MQTAAERNEAAKRAGIRKPPAEELDELRERVKLMLATLTELLRKRHENHAPIEKRGGYSPRQAAPSPTKLPPKPIAAATSAKPPGSRCSPRH